MAGAEFVPQRAILPQVDLVITHGGNNTVTECFHDGRPMILLPLFWDQYDNAQRIAETGFGVRLPTYTFEPESMSAAIDRLLADRALRARLAADLRSPPGPPGDHPRGRPHRAPGGHRRARRDRVRRLRRASAGSAQSGPITVRPDASIRTPCPTRRQPR